LIERFDFRLLSDACTCAPATGLLVESSLLVPIPATKASLGTPVTSGEGVFTLQIAALRPTNGRPRSIHLELQTSYGIALAPVDVQVNPGTAQTQEIRVTIPAPPAPPPPQLDSIATQLGEVPASLFSGLSKLQDLQAAGDLSELAGFTGSASDPGVIRLQAHADLSCISANPALNSYLIHKGFSSPYAIATTTQPEFVSAVRERAGDFNAAALHTRATAYSHFISNVVQGALAAPPAWLMRELWKYSALSRCDCEDRWTTSRNNARACARPLASLS
jgi:hypothetical protein